MLRITPLTNKPLLKNLDQIIQSIDTNISMSMFLQMNIPLIQKQHRRRTSLMSRRHIINTIPNLKIISFPSEHIIQKTVRLTHHNQTLGPIRQTPFLGNMQNASWIRLGNHIRCVSRNYRQEYMLWQVIVEKIPDR